MNKHDVDMKIAQILMQSRYASGRSQEYVAGRLGLSTRTIQNWENAKSMPDAAQLYNWFNAIQIPPQPYILKILYPDIDDSIFDNDVKIDNALCNLVKDLPTHEKKKLLFILQGSHGSSPSSVIDLMVANLQCPLRDRLGICQSIISNYEIADELDVLTDKSAIRPSVNNMKTSLQSAIVAVKKRLNSYSK